MNNFQEMGLPPVLIQALDKLGFIHPTAIQAKTIPLALQHKDILGSAQTGTGKTLAFTLPLVNHLLNNPTGMGLILTPTRELAQQILLTVNQLLGEIPFIKTALLIGGGPYAKQMSQLRSSDCMIIIGTPGRIIDHLGRRSFKTKPINFLVLDETDRMFDMGFSEQLEEIVSQLPTQRQTLMFSATFPPKIERLAAEYMHEPERVFIKGANADSMVAPNLTQEVVEVKEENKYTELLTQLTSREGSILVFVKTKSDAEHLAVRLRKEEHNTCAIHGNLRQNKREQVMRAFRQGRHRIMVATDIAARGLDVPHILHVINYDIPHTPEDYIHRIGRTARAGAKGFAISFVSSQDRRRWNAIQVLINPGQAKFEAATDRNRNSRKSGTNTARNSNSRRFEPNTARNGNSRTFEAGTARNGNARRFETDTARNGNSRTFETNTARNGNSRTFEADTARNGNSRTFEAGTARNGNSRTFEAGAARSGNSRTFETGAARSGNSRTFETGTARSGNSRTFETGTARSGNSRTFETGTGRNGNARTFEAGTGRNGNTRTFEAGPGRNGNTRTFDSKSPFQRTGGAKNNYQKATSQPSFKHAKKHR
jgi:superfamily II DNA/RNA helicase